ncbi:MAG: response regulator [Hyphomonadaceae bacterium]
MSDGQTVFIADDDEAVRDSLAALLGAASFKVETFGTGEDLLDRLDFESRGCVILDVRMPGLSGIEVQARMVELHNSMPVIMITGHGDLAMAVQSMKDGAFDFIEKPFDEDTITQSLLLAMSKSAETEAASSQVADIENSLARLTTREREVLEELVLGNLNKVIAFNLEISPRTVEIHRARVMEKMQARNLAHLVRLALTGGVIPGTGSE